MALVDARNSFGGTTSTPAAAVETTTRSLPEAPLPLLPPDILLTIASLVSPSTLLNLALASSAFYDILLPLLYQTLVLPSSDHCLTVLPRLNCRNSQHVSYIRKLVLKPNDYLAWPRKDRRVDEDWVAGMVGNVAKEGRLCALESLEWKGMEVPPDEMWEALRLGCPRLKTILTIVGTKLIDPQSKLFDFSNLISFSIIVRHRGLRLGTGTTYYPTTLTPLPSKFWDMIHNRCSQTLSKLQICSFSPKRVSFDVGPLFFRSVRFPNLTSLTLGVFGYRSDYTIPDTSCALLGDFLAKHPSITYLRVLWNVKRWLLPDNLSFFPLLLLLEAPPPPPPPSLILPKLDTFVGVYQQLASIPLESRKHIRTVDLTCEPLYEMGAYRAWDVLKTVRGLKSLDVWVHFPPLSSTLREEASERMLTTMVDACMGLEEIHFMSTVPFSMKLFDQFLHSLSRLVSLRRVSLTKRHVYQDESMFDTAVRVLRACKGVERVCVRYGREMCLNHLKKEGVYEVIDRDTVSAKERGISLFGRGYEKRFSGRLIM